MQLQVKDSNSIEENMGGQVKAQKGSRFIASELQIAPLLRINEGIFVTFYMEWKNYIISDNIILLGKPTVKGTRISVEHIIGLLAQDWT